MFITDNKQDRNQIINLRNVRHISNGKDERITFRYDSDSVAVWKYESIERKEEVWELIQQAIIEGKGRDINNTDAFFATFVD